jgi:hypothetical protein
MTELFARTRLDRVNTWVARGSWTLVAGALLLAGCAPDVRTIDNTAAASVTYTVGPGWTPRGQELRVGATSFSGVEEYGSGETLVASTLVPHTRDVDKTLTDLMQAGLIAALYGPEAKATGGSMANLPGTTGYRVPSTTPH